MLLYSSGIETAQFWSHSYGEGHQCVGVACRILLGQQSITNGKWDIISTSIMVKMTVHNVRQTVVFIFRYFIIAVGLTLCYSHFDFVGQYVYIVATVFTAYWVVWKMCHITCRMVLLLALFAWHGHYVKMKPSFAIMQNRNIFPPCFWNWIVVYIIKCRHENLHPRSPPNNF